MLSLHCTAPALICSPLCLPDMFCNVTVRGVNSLESLAFSIPCLLVQGQNPLLKVISVIQGVNLSDLTPTPNSAKAFFFVIMAVLCHCDPSEQCNGLKNWVLRATLPFQPHFGAC